MYNDLLLHASEAALKKSGNPYTVFTPFFRHAQGLVTPEPQKFSYTNFFTKSSSASSKTKQHLITSQLMRSMLIPFNKVLHVQGGTHNALAILKDIADYKDYAKTRNFPALSTTNLSAHHKFGTISIRTVYTTIA